MQRLIPVGVLGFLTLCAVALSQSVATTPIRIGDVAQSLSKSDVAGIERALPAGARPWLLVGFPGQSRAFQWIEAYLQSDKGTREVRRGTMTRLSRRATDAAIPDAWTINNNFQQGQGMSESYAQVAIKDRSFDQISGDSDSNRPFFLSGQIEDSELVSLVNFVRSSPVAAGPVESVTRELQDSMRVTTRVSVNLWQVLTVQKQGAGWVITRIARGQA